MNYSHAVVELKYETGKLVIVKVNWIMNLKPNYSKTQDFFCYWSPDLEDSPEQNECGYSKKFNGLPSLFKVFVVQLTNSIEEAQKCLEGRVKMVAKRFREPGDTEGELKKIESKKKRNAKKELKEQKAYAHAKNMEYIFNEMSEHSAANIVGEKENSEMQLDLPIMSIPTPTNSIHDPLGPITSTSLSEFVCDIQTPLIVSKTIKTNPPDLAMQQSDLPSSLQLSACSSYDEYIQILLNEQWEDNQMGNAGNQDENEEFILTTLVVPTSTKTNATDVSVQQSDLPSPLQLSACSSYDEYIQILLNEQWEDNQMENAGIRENRDVNEESDVHITVPVTNASDTSSMVDGSNVVIINIDELTTKDEMLTKENQELKQEIYHLKKELESANKRNLLLQNLLVEADERAAQTIFIEKDGGRLYRGGVFLNEKQCAILDKAKSDREYLNNLATAIFGRKVLETSSISGAPSNRTKGKKVLETSSDTSAPIDEAKGKGKLKLNPDLLQLTYDIMDARSVKNKTEKLSKTVKNAIIGKKCTNAATAADVAAAKTKI